jgi:DNA-binding Lrp family transcriptional regulator
MVTAYIMVKSLTGEADRLRNSLLDIDGIVDVHIVAGDVDLIAKAIVDEPADVKAIAADQVHDIDGVDETQTYIAMD